MAQEKHFLPLSDKLRIYATGRMVILVQVVNENGRLKTAGYYNRLNQALAAACEIMVREGIADGTIHDLQSLKQSLQTIETMLQDVKKTQDHS